MEGFLLRDKMKGIYAPDGYAYCKDTDDEITKLIRRIEISNKAECGVNFTQAPAVVLVEDETDECK